MVLIRHHNAIVQLHTLVSIEVACFADGDVWTVHVFQLKPQLLRYTVPVNEATISLPLNTSI